MSIQKSMNTQINMEGEEDKVILTTVTDMILQQQDLKFVYINTGIEYTSVKDVPDNSKLKFNNKYCYWWYRFYDNT